MPGPQLPTVVVSMATYGELHQGSSRVPICLHNLSTLSMEILTKAVVGQVAPTTQVLLVVLLTRTAEEANDKPQKGWVLEALDLLAQTRAETGQRIAAQMGTPVCAQ